MGFARLPSPRRNLGTPRSEPLRGRAAGAYPNCISPLLPIILFSHNSPFGRHHILQRPQLAFGWWVLNWFKINLDSFLLGFFPNGQDMHHSAGFGERPGGQCDGYLTGAREGGKAPVDFLTAGDGGDGLAVEFGEVEVVLGDTAGAL